MLPGIGGVGGFMRQLTEFLIASASATGNGTGGPVTYNFAINKPTGTASGDILVAAVMTRNGSGGNTWTPPAGWTEVIDQNAEPNLTIAYKVAGGAEGASYTFSINDNSTKTGIIACFRGIGWDAAGAAADTLTGNGSLVLTGITSTAGVPGGLLLAIAASGDAGTPTQSTPSGMTLVETKTDANGRRLSMFQQNIDAGATGTRTSTIAGMTNTSAGILVGLK